MVQYDERVLVGHITSITLGWNRFLPGLEGFFNFYNNSSKLYADLPYLLSPPNLFEH